MTTADLPGVPWMSDDLAPPNAVAPYAQEAPAKQGSDALSTECTPYSRAIARTVRPCS